MNKRTGALLAVAGGLVILVLTLGPSSGRGSTELEFWCVLCGPRGLADGLLNLALFAPFGAGLTLLGGPILAFAGSLGLSTFVEVLQLTMPSRFSTLGDILFNTLGGGTGALLVISVRGFSKNLPLLGTRIGFAALTLPLVLFLLTASLLSPSVPPTVLYGQWAHRLGRLRPYPGRVLSASAGGLALPDGRLPDQAEARDALALHEPLLVRIVVGPQPGHPTHLFAVYDDLHREILLLSVQGPDLLFRRRTLSARFGLDQPAIVWHGAINASPGDTMLISVHQRARNLCLAAGEQVRCDLSPGVEGGWRLLMAMPGAPGGLSTTLNVLWLLLLSVPAGFAFPRARTGLFGAGVLAGAGAAISAYSPDLSLHAPILVALLIGAALGTLPRVWARKRFPHPRQGGVRGLHSGDNRGTV